MHDLHSNREGITLLWFDPTIKEANIPDFTIPHLRSVNDYILIYSDKLLYVDYLESEKKRNDRIIAILHGAENLDETHACEQIQAILLILSIDENENKSTPMIETNSKKVIEIFKDRSSMLEKLQQVIVQVEHQSTKSMTNIFSTFNPPQERSLRNLENEWVSFIWRYAFKSKYKNDIKFHFEKNLSSSNQSDATFT